MICLRRTSSKKRGGSERVPLKCLVNGGPDRRTSASPSVDVPPAEAAASGSAEGSRQSLNERKSCLSRSSSSEDENLSPAVPQVERRRAVVVEGPVRATLVTIRTEK